MDFKKFIVPIAYEEEEEKKIDGTGFIIIFAGKAILVTAGHTFVNRGLDNFYFFLMKIGIL